MAGMYESHLNCQLTEALMKTFDALVVIATPEGRIVQFNKACELLTGYSEEDVVGQLIVDLLVPPEQRDDVASVIEELSSPGTNRFENDWIAADGRRLRIMWSNTNVTDSNGRVEAVVGTGLDVTGQRQLESRLAQADRLDSIGRLVTAIAHDFNNSLTGLCLRVERLADRDLDSDSRGDVEAIIKLIDRAQNVINELLSFSSPRLPTPKQVEINAEVSGVHDMLGGVFTPDIEVDLDLASESTTVRIDRVGFEQAFTNLLMNARDAMPDGGRLTVTTSIVASGRMADVPVPDRTGSKSYVRLSVTDTGSGIAPDDLGHVFDPYFTTKPSGRGTGLGLATAYATIHGSGGAITVDSEPGRGTTFDVWLPLVADDA